jgi:hypothetical protein
MAILGLKEKKVEMKKKKKKMLSRFGMWVFEKMG